MNIIFDLFRKKAAPIECLTPRRRVVNEDTPMFDSVPDYGFYGQAPTSYTQRPISPVPVALPPPPASTTSLFASPDFALSEVNRKRAFMDIDQEPIVQITPIKKVKRPEQIASQSRHKKKTPRPVKRTPYSRGPYKIEVEDGWETRESRLLRLNATPARVYQETQALPEIIQEEAPVQSISTPIFNRVTSPVKKPLVSILKSTPMRASPSLNVTPASRFRIPYCVPDSRKFVNATPVKSVSLSDDQIDERVVNALKAAGQRSGFVAKEEDSFVRIYFAECNMKKSPATANVKPAADTSVTNSTELLNSSSLQTSNVTSSTVDKKQASDQTSAASVFSFGQPSTATTNLSLDSQKPPAFSFGPPSTPSSDVPASTPLPTAIEQSNTVPAVAATPIQPKFSFGSTPSTETPKPVLYQSSTTKLKSSFPLFGQPVTSANSAVPLFGTTAPKQQEPSNTKKEEPAQPFSMSFGSQAKQSLQFGNTESNTGAPKTEAITFGSNSETSAFKPLSFDQPKQTPSAVNASAPTDSKPFTFGMPPASSNPTVLASSVNTPASQSNQFSFGSTVAPSQNLFGSQSTPSQPSFGSNATPIQASGSNPTAVAPIQNAFGAAVPAQSIFGGSATATPNTFGTASVASAPVQPVQNMFGSTTPSTFGSSTTVPTFGSSNNAAPSQNLFGSSNAAPTQNAFGSINTAPAQPTFGSQATPSTTNFGSQNPPSNQGTFGNSQANIFGSQANPPTSMFGNQAAPNQNGTSSQTPAFGSQASAFTFGKPAAPQFGQNANTFNAGQAAPAFGQASTAPAFGQAASAPAFGQVPTPAFGQSATPAFSQSLPAFGQGAPTAFGQSTGQSQATPFGQASTPAFGQGTSTFGQGAPSFGQSQPTTNQQSVPFSFGNQPQTASFGTPPPQGSQSGFQFNSTTPAAAAPFQIGAPGGRKVAVARPRRAGGRR